MAVAAGRLPHSLILAGAAGSGKYTLALMLTMAVECERQPRNLWSNGQSLAAFCGHCRNCTRIAQAANLEEVVAAAVLAREELRETDKKETRVLVQPHPDVLILPPDPPQLLIKLGQVRTLIQRSQYLPSEAPKKIFILTSASLMKEAANSLLKVLEEPPPSVHILLLAENPSELLPTIRSRCALVRLGALPVEEMEMLVSARRPELSLTDRELVARLAQGAAGQALSFDLPAYRAARADAFLLHTIVAHCRASSARSPAKSRRARIAGSCHGPHANLSTAPSTCQSSGSMAPTRSKCRAFDTAATSSPSSATRRSRAFGA